MALHDESTEISRVQRLYDASYRVFSSGKAGLPTLRHIRWLQEFLDVMEPSDVGIDASSDDEGLSDAESSPRSRNGLILGKTVKQITYIHIHECEDFSIGIFCFPAGAKFPLHDHPNMVVLSKVLYGSVRSKSYDWVTSPCSSLKKGGLAKLVSDNRLIDARCKASVLFPRSGGNLHSFYAETPCAILDVLSPPYSEDMGRPSKYYSDIPIPNLPGYAVLKETDHLPDDLTVRGAPYMGPELSLKAMY
ncbi:putative 2-aminoethanethiol dioxygenase [Carex littledalei]|uniref:cysteine dioxygenase n=1 Tax=Carex littledalei TaxID=544730 RepID=A0A833R8P4_9POAL|nr:putative 2-aminoethanethiol dioxygenase [Carex littledalei]